MRTELVAEVGSNHGGDLRTALKMVEVAAQCGVTHVKFQKRHPRVLYTKSFYDTSYNSEHAFGATYGEHREALELSYSDYFALKEKAQECGVILFATAFDKPSVDFCVGLDLPIIKIASGSLSNLPLIEYAASFGRPLYISTGGGTMQMIGQAFAAAGLEVTLLQCTAAYPCPADKLDLSVIQTLKILFGCRIGVSMHFNGISMPLAAVALGAEVVEVHFTLDRSSKGTDHAFSLEPQGLRRLARDIARLESALGDGRKRIHQIELDPILKMSVSIYTAKAFPAGHVLSESDLVLKSPGGGLAPDQMSRLTGRMLLRDVAEEHPLSLEDVDGRLRLHEGQVLHTRSA